MTTERLMTPSPDRGRMRWKRFRYSHELVTAYGDILQRRREVSTVRLVATLAMQSEALRRALERRGVAPQPLSKARLQPGQPRRPWRRQVSRELRPVVMNAMALAEGDGRDTITVVDLLKAVATEPHADAKLAVLGISARDLLEAAATLE